MKTSKEIYEKAKNLEALIEEQKELVAKYESIVDRLRLELVTAERNLERIRESRRDTLGAIALDQSILASKMLVRICDGMGVSRD